MQITVADAGFSTAAHESTLFDSLLAEAFDGVADPPSPHRSRTASVRHSLATPLDDARQMQPMSPRPVDLLEVPAVGSLVP